jgi:hypothetical protein
VVSSTDESPSTAGSERIDVHQHLWPSNLIEALRSRNTPPMMRGWTLELTGEPPYQVNPADHDVATRARADDLGLALISLSSPLGLEDLPAAEAGALLDGWHAGAAGLPAGFGAWAAVSRRDPDLAGLADLFAAGFRRGMIIAATLCAAGGVIAWATIRRPASR